MTNSGMTSRPLMIYKASAGSGKTFRLAVEYIKLLIENPKSYGNILAVTFTNKATAEMKLRILSQLYGIGHNLRSSDGYLKAIQADEHIRSLNLSEEELRRRAGVALSLMMHDYNRFRIETIDSFFQGIMRQLAHELRLTNNLRVDLNNKEVLEEAVKELFNSLADDKELLQSVLRLVEEKMDDGKNWNMTNEVIEFGMNIFNEKFLTNKHNEHITTREDVEQFKIEIYRHKTATLQQLQQLGQEFLDVCSREGIDASWLRGGRGNSGIYPFFEKTAAENGLPNISTSIRSFLESASAWPSPKHPEVEPVAEGVLLPLLRQVIDLRYRLNTIECTRTHIGQLMLINTIDAKVRQLNTEENRFLLADTAYILWRLIKGQDIPFIYEKAGVRFTHIMIDEFQDTSALQWRNFVPLLLNSMATNSRCLIVGDVKQSIYRWRNGDWEILNGIEHDEQFGPLVESTAMKDNFRSSERIIRFNNEFFSNAALALQDLYRQNTGAATTLIADAYEDVEQLPRPENEGMGYVHVEFIDKPDEGETSVSPMLQRIVENVRTLREQGVRPRDICILVRTKNEIPDICATFAEQMPDVSIVSDEAFRLDSSPAVNFIILCLRLIDDPQNRFLLAMLVQQYESKVKSEKVKVKMPDECRAGDTDSLFLLDEVQLRQRLPEAFVQAEDSLPMVPLYELAERIYDMFSLREIAGQDSYLFSFFDQLMLYLADRPSDLERFLQYWDEKLCGVTIPVGEIEGIRILSIHKSKGLEFGSVIMPYCDWRFVMGGHHPLMWCQPTTAPFNHIDLLPIDMTDQSRDSYFTEDYKEEKLKTYVDNLNLMYVAFTRAKDNLIILADRHSTPKDRSGSSNEQANYVLDVSLPRLLMVDEGDGKSFSWGDIVPSKESLLTEPTKDGGLSAAADPPNVLTIHPKPEPTHFVTQHVEATFRQSNRATEFAQGDDDEEVNAQRRYVSEGVLFHQLLSMLRTSDDLPSALQRMDFEGYFSNLLIRRQVEQMAQKALSHPEASAWFDPHWQVINESTILYRDADGIVQQRRPDRVVTDGQRTIVVDYKTGRPHPQHQQQVAFYVDKLREMGYPEVCGYVWYIRHGNIVPVG